MRFICLTNQSWQIIIKTQLISFISLDGISTRLPSIKRYTSFKVSGKSCPATKVSRSNELDFKIEMAGEKTKLRPRKDKCYHCQETFASITQLNEHIDSKHKGIKPFKCKLCDNSFTLKSYLKRHIAANHEEHRFKCTKCDYSCSQNCHLDIHIAAVHERKKPFQCDKCKAAFSLKSHLKSHVKSIHEFHIKSHVKSHIKSY